MGMGQDQGLEPGWSEGKEAESGAVPKPRYHLPSLRNNPRGRVGAHLRQTIALCSGKRLLQEGPRQPADSPNPLLLSTIPLPAPPLHRGPGGVLLSLFS